MTLWCWWWCVILACPHPIGDYVFYDTQSLKTGAIDSVKTYVDSFMPFIMCQFPTVTDPNFLTLYRPDKKCQDFVSGTCKLLWSRSLHVTSCPDVTVYAGVMRVM